MGMRTDILDSCIEVHDMEGLKQWLADMKAGKFPEYEKTAEDYTEVITFEKDGKHINFDKMDNWKIISYWYTSFCMFLRDIAVFLKDGEIEMRFETEEEYGHIRFEEGVCLVTTGRMTYDPVCNIEDIREDEISEMPMDLQKRLAMRKL